MILPVLALLLQATTIGITCNSIASTGIALQCRIVPYVPTPSLQNGLISYWKLEEVSGLRADSSDGVSLSPVSGVYGDTGKIGNAAVFTSENLDVLSSISSTLSLPLTDFTVSAWINPVDLSDASTLGKGIASYHDEENPGDWILSVGSAGEIIFFHWKTGGNDTTGKHLTATGVITTGSFQHIVLRRAGGTYTVWKNGVSISIITNTNTGTGYVSDKFYVGSSFANFSPSNNWWGWIDEVGVWNRNLSDVEIGQLYNAGAGLTYPF